MTVSCVVVWEKAKLSRTDLSHFFFHASPTCCCTSDQPAIHVTVQAMARVWRDGQTRKVFIYRLLCTGTIEEKIYQRQISKQGLSGAVVDDKAGEASSSVAFSLDELRDLFTLRVDTTSETYDLLGRPDADGRSTKASAKSTALAVRGSAKKPSNQLSMDELMKWKHFEPPVTAEQVDDGFLHQCPAALFSCLFMNRTEPAALEAEELAALQAVATSDSESKATVEVGDGDAEASDAGDQIDTSKGEAAEADDVDMLACETEEQDHGRESDENAPGLSGKRRSRKLKRADSSSSDEEEVAASAKSELAAAAADDELDADLSSL